MKVSIIIRMFNEAFYLRHTLDALISQNFPEDFEIIIVDNCSTDDSVMIAKKYTDRILTIEEYTPGKGLNMAIECAQGEFIAVLSAHTIPANRDWLLNLYAYTHIPCFGGVYGAQLYPINSKFLDKRDLDIFSTLHPRVEIHDTDFWNANSLFPRALWKQQPFDEQVFELEDHYWTKLLTPRGYRFYFEPQALVYHYSHIDRIDREHLPASSDDDIIRIDNAVLDLKNPSANWPVVMRAGLTLSSLTHSTHIHQATTIIGETLLHHSDFDVRWRMAQALGKIPSAESVTYLIKALSDRSFYPQDEAAWSLARLGEISIPGLLEAIEQLSPDRSIFAALALGRSGIPTAEEKAVICILKLLDTNDVTQLCNVVYFAGEIAQAASAKHLIQPLNELLKKSDHPRLRMICCWALGELGKFFEKDVDWVKLQELAVTDQEMLTRFEAIIALGKRAATLGALVLLENIIERLKDPADRVRYGVIQSVRRFLEINPTVVIPQIESILCWQDNDNGVNFEQDLIRRTIV